MSDGLDLATLESIQQRILWLAVRMVDHANHERLLPPVGDGGHVKVGGHQASSASMVGIMTALWFGHLNGDDKVAVKPHASPVFHAIKYLTGELDRSWLTRLRELGGLQAYPSRTKDPDVFDFSTGSVGLGAVAPLFAAATRRYIDAHFGARPHARFIALVGDAELDEGNVWEAIADPALQGLGNVTWIVDLNRQSLDRVIPGMKARRLMQFFEESGWHVVEAKYGRRLQEAFARPGGDALRRHIDDMSNEEYQSLFAFQGAELRQRFLAHADAAVKALLDEVPDDDLAPLVQNLGGHDLGELIDCYRQCDAVTDRPSIVWAYTVKGWGLPIAGDPLNHAALLSTGQIASLRAAAGLTPETEWDRFAPGTPEAVACARVGGEVNNVPVPPRPVVPVPIEVGVAPVKVTSTQETFGRLLTGLAGHAEVAARLVTTSPDVSVSTNLGGFINKLGVFAPADEPDFLGEGRLLRWRQGPTGHHVELGISEMNLFLMLGQLGLGHELHGEMLLPIGTVYDPFVCRGLDALIYGAYSASRFVVVGTPSGISLAPEGGAHQSTVTASIGVELPGVTFVEPAYATALDWLLCDGLRRLCDPDGDAMYLRLSTRPIDQAPFEAARARLGDEQLRTDVLAGGYRLVEGAGADGPTVNLVASGAVVPEAVAAAALLADEGVVAHVIDVTSMGRLYAGWRSPLLAGARTGTTATGDPQLARLLPEADRGAPIVTVHDAASHALAWVGSVFGAPVVPVGVDAFGQSGSIPELYGVFDLLPEQLVNAALVAVSGSNPRRR
jgi:pyruvate dehydrogenase E1 component